MKSLRHSVRMSGLLYMRECQALDCDLRLYFHAVLISSLAGGDRMAPGATRIAPGLKSPWHYVDWRLREMEIASLSKSVW
jgi:hypothetical protein